MNPNRIFLKVDLPNWVFGAIEKVQAGANWNQAWVDTYFELGGKSPTSATKVCPMNAAETLYLLGRIKGGGISRKTTSLESICADYSKNGFYAALALEVLSQHSDVSLNQLWCVIRSIGESRFKINMPESNQGAATVAFILWHLDLIIEKV